MSYDIRYNPRCKEEVGFLKATYGATFSQDLDNWLKNLASEASNPKSTASVDAIELFEELTDEGAADAWAYVKRRFLNASLRQKILALLVVARKRCPPWQLRSSFAWFTLLDSISAGVAADYVVDHIEKRVIFLNIELSDSEAAS